MVPPAVLLSIILSVPSDLRINEEARVVVSKVRLFTMCRAIFRRSTNASRYKNIRAIAATGTKYAFLYHKKGVRGRDRSLSISLGPLIYRLPKVSSLNDPPRLT